MRLLGHLGDTGVPVYGLPRLSERARAIVRAVAEWWDRTGHGPSVRELMAETGIRGSATICAALDELVERGVLRREPYLSRTLRVAS